MGALYSDLNGTKEGEDGTSLICTGTTVLYVIHFKGISFSSRYKNYLIIGMGSAAAEVEEGEDGKPD